MSDALYAGFQQLLAETKIGSYPNKEIYLLTDGEAETDWEQLERTGKELSGHGVSLTVV